LSSQNNFPHFEHVSSAHFATAGRLARRLGIINIHSLYSSEELTSARDAAVLAAVAEESAEVANARFREARSVPLRFHDQIKALWEYDLALQLNDTVSRKNRPTPWPLIDNILTGCTPEPASFRSLARYPERSQWLESMAQERTTL
jgi:hypothetical protein